jgi:restriction system protein
MLPLLRLAGDGLDHRVRDAVMELGIRFELTEQEMTTLTPSGSDFVFSNRVGWARAYLRKAGLIRSASWGKFSITSAGRMLLDQNPALIDLSVLKRYEAFREWWTSSKPSAEGTSSSVEALLKQETPEESIRTLHTALREHLQAELLAKLIAGSPKYFEKLVVRLLIAIGYGGPVVDAGQVLGGSHDGGIDGVIKEDKLGLDLIYIQAKKWGTATVGAPDVQGFVGALAGKKARKGVFITTSKFSQEAWRYVGGLENRVILIDGEKLTELMFEYGLGVTTVNTYDVKRIDNDFFDEDEQ